MARKKKEPSATLLDGIIALEESKNLTREFLMESFEASLSRAYIKTFLKGWLDAPVRTDINLETGSIVIYRGKKVVLSDDDIQDDFVEVAATELKEKGIEAEVGSFYETAITLNEIIEGKFGQKFINSFMTSFKQKLLDAERRALNELYGSKKGELITGRIEQNDDKSGESVVNIGKTTVTLKKYDKIGDETFKIGQDIKVCITGVEETPKGANIRISRSDKLFLKRLFEQEIREIFDGTVVIKEIARKAGLRSKIAVYSNDPNVDACGACIGTNGSRIQAITQYLGNSKEKEKIDIIQYNSCDELFIAEALLPGKVIGIIIDRNNVEEGKVTPKAIVITRNGEKSSTIGARGINVQLASMLTGYKIDVKEADEALREGLSYSSIDEINERLNGPKTPIEEIDPFAEVDIDIDDNEEEIEVEETEEVTTPEEVEQEAEVEVEPTPVVEETPVVEPTPVIETPKEPEVQIDDSGVVKMDDLLSKLEEEKAAAEKSSKTRKSFKKKEEKIEVVKEEKEKIQGMAIYTEEELEELRRQEELEDEEDSYGVDVDDDYDEYDSDDYYED